jgi:hypothetical protein
VAESKRQKYGQKINILNEKFYIPLSTNFEVLRLIKCDSTNNYYFRSSYIQPNGPASWSSGKSFCLLIMRCRVQFPFLPWGFFLEGKDSHGDHGLGGLVELRLKPLLILHIQISPSTSSERHKLHLMGIPTSEVSYTSATTGRENHEVHKEHVVGRIYIHTHIAKCGYFPQVPSNLATSLAI